MRVEQRYGERGSLRWIQRLIAARYDLLETQLPAAGVLHSGEVITWRSPLPHDRWAEYRDAAFLERLDLTPLIPALRRFWPVGGPQWDALGVTERRSVFLVEAKAHLGELRSACGARATHSRQRIAEALADARRAFGCRPEADWSAPYYQYANRLAHLRFLRAQGVSAHLVFVYFIGETGMPGAPISQSQWKDELARVRHHLGFDSDAHIPGVVDVFVDVAELADARLDALARVVRLPSGADFARGYDRLEEAGKAEGAVVYVADAPGTFSVITDETTLVDMLGEDLPAITVRSFSQLAARDLYVHALLSRLRRVDAPAS